MNRTARFVLVGVASLAAIGASVTIAHSQGTRGNDKQTPPTGESMQLPPGWTMEDMQACMEAGTPGEMHEFLAKSAGRWRAKTTMWMAPGAEPMESDGSSTVTPLMDGRYVQVEMKGEMPGMGAYNGLGLYGFDNVSEKFQSTWIDNHSTGMMLGTGALSSDKKELSWTYAYSCPLTNKPTTMREVERITGENTRTLEMFATDPKSGKEFRMMRIELTRDGTPSRPAPTPGSGTGSGRGTR